MLFGECGEWVVRRVKKHVEDVVIKAIPPKTWATFWWKVFSRFGDLIPYIYRNLIRILERSFELDVNRPSPERPRQRRTFDKA